MLQLKILLGILAVAAAWLVIFRRSFIFKLNQLMRERVFNDQLVLFSGRRVAILLIVLGGLALFSGISDIRDAQPIPDHIAREIILKAQSDLATGQYHRVVKRTRDLVRSNPKNTDAWELLTQGAWAMGQRDLAKQAVDALLRIDPLNEFGRKFYTNNFGVLPSVDE
jgi:cytochrome c-type biogenesis protein CcmH/NrfG